MKQKMSIIIVIVFIIFLCSCKSTDNRKSEFVNQKNEFETVKNFIILQNTKKTHEISYAVLRDDGIVTGLHNISDMAPNVVQSLNAISNLFKHDFSYIQYTHERISFGGNGSEMYVYMLNDNKPDYFYYSGDDVKFSCEKFANNWFFLYNRVR